MWTIKLGKESDVKALVVDDSSVMRRVLTSALASANIDRVDEVGDGSERCRQPRPRTTIWC